MWLLGKLCLASFHDDFCQRVLLSLNFLLQLSFDLVSYLGVFAMFGCLQQSTNAQGEGVILVGSRPGWLH